MHDQKSSGIVAGNRADVAIRHLLSHLFDIIEQNERIVVDTADAEAVHDFRVAIRRSRSLLANSHGILPRRVTEPARNNFAWLMSNSNRVRDLQVLLEKLDGFVEALPKACEEELHAFRLAVQKQLDLAIRQMQRQLGSIRYRRFKHKWQQYLQSSVPDQTSLPGARDDVAEAADRLIHAAWEKVLKKGRHIHPDSPSGEIHKLRIACKKFRYNLEFFSVPDAMEKEIGVLEDLQDSLGELQDIYVQRALFEDETLNRNMGKHCLHRLDSLLDKREKHLRKKAVKDFHAFRKSWKHKKL